MKLAEVRFKAEIQPYSFSKIKTIVEEIKKNFVKIK